MSNDPVPQEPQPPPHPQPPPGSMPPPPPIGPAPGPFSQPQGRDNTQLYGILGIVIAVICCAPLGILFGYLSMQEARKYGKDETLGKVAFWLGIALTALSVIAAILAVCFGAFGTWNVNRNHYNP